MARSGRRFEQLRQAEWISFETAHAITGCSRERLKAAVSAGDIEQRQVTRRWRPSLRRTSVVAWAAKEAAANEQALRIAQQKADQRAAEIAAKLPPPDGHVYLTADAAAVVLGISRVRVGQLAREDRLPVVRRGRRMWFRRDLIEQIAAAREWRRERSQDRALR